MRILLDECLPRKLKNSLGDHDCTTVPGIGLAGKKNGELLKIAEGLGFEILLTMDRGLQYPQPITGRLCASSNKLSDLLPLVDECLERIETIGAGHIARVGQ